MYKKEFKYLSEYMDIVIQLIVSGVKKVDLPTFEYYCKIRENYKYSLHLPTMVDTIYMVDGKFELYYTHTKGLSNKPKSLFYREYNYWNGVKYYTGGNILGKYKLNLEFR